MHHSPTPTPHRAGALATSEAEQALADSWQKLIMLRLKSQKLQLRQQAQPMSQTDMERVEARADTANPAPPVRHPSRAPRAALTRLAYGIMHPVVPP